MLCFLASFVIIPLSNADEAPLRDVLESRWKNYVESVKSGDESWLKETMSSYKFGVYVNELANSRRVPTPESIKNSLEGKTDIHKMKFVNLVKSGPTAALIYVSGTDYVDVFDNPCVLFTFIKFVKEETTWKVYGKQEFVGSKYGCDSDQFKFDMSRLPSEYLIDGKVQKAPEPIPFPAHAGNLMVGASGYETRVILNGVELEPFISISGRWPIDGGLLEGDNSIKIICKRINLHDIFKPKVIVRHNPDQGEPEVVFSFEPEGWFEGTHTATFIVEDKIKK